MILTEKKIKYKNNKWHELIEDYYASVLKRYSSRHAVLNIRTLKEAYFTKINKEGANLVYLETDIVNRTITNYWEAYWAARTSNFVFLDIL